VHTGTLHFNVMADATRLRQVLLNLLSNAVKYNRPGGGVHIEALPRGNTFCCASPTQAAGMSDEQLQHLFEPFNRLGVQRDGSDAMKAPVSAWPSSRRWLNTWAAPCTWTAPSASGAFLNFGSSPWVAKLFAKGRTSCCRRWWAGAAAR
jgi:hypothetical protein